MSLLRHYCRIRCFSVALHPQALKIDVFKVPAHSQASPPAQALKQQIPVMELTVSLKQAKNIERIISREELQC